jgi:hypothetical protein
LCDVDLEWGGVGASLLSVEFGSIDNNSSENESVSGDRTKEFSTLSSYLGVSTDATSSTLETQMRWYNGFQSKGGSAQVHKRNVTYDLLFSVFDASSLGYSLSIETLLRGYSVARLEGESGNVSVTSTTLSGRFDDFSDMTNTLTTQVSELTISNSTGALSNELDERTDVATDKQQSFLLDDTHAFSGTRSFALRFTTLGTPTTNVFMANDVLGQGSVRFGLSNLQEALNDTGIALQGQLADIELGHFVTVTATSLSEPPPPPISAPEPTSIALLALGLAGMGMTARRRTT